MSRRLQGRIAIITGSSSGIGRATAFAMAAEGAKIVCSDLQEGTWRTVQTEYDGGDQATTPSTRESGITELLQLSRNPADEHKGPTHERIRTAGGEAMFIKADVTDPASVEALVAAAVKEYGRLDIMINNAGFATESRQPGPIWETPIDLFSKTMAANVHGVFHGIKYAAAQMIKQEPLPSGDRGWILNAASVYGLVGTAGAPAYCTSKGAVANMTRAAALDCAPHRIHVNAVCPGYVATHMTDPLWDNADVAKAVESLHPFRGVGKPEDIAKAYVFLASDDAQWMSGVCMPVDGGYTAR